MHFTNKFSKHYAVLILIIGFGALKRLQGAVNGTFAFTHDQGKDFLAAFKVTHGDLTLIGPTTGLAGLYHGPLWYYLLAFFIFLGDGNPKFVLGAIILLFLIAELFLFFLVKKYLGGFSAYLLISIITLSPLYVGFNGQIWAGSMTPLSSLVAAIAIFGIAFGKKWYWILGFTLGANIQFEAAGGTFLLIATLGTLIIVNPFRTSMRNYGVMFLTFILTLIPQIIFELKYSFLMTKHALTYLGVSRSDFIAEHGIKSVEYKTALIIDNFSKAFSNNIDIALIMALLLFVLLCKFYLNKNRLEENSAKIILYFGSTIFFFWISINFYFDVVWGHFINGLSISFVMVVVLLFHNLKKSFGFVVQFTAFAIIAYMAFQAVKGFDLRAKIVGDISYYKNHLEVIDDVYQDANGQEFNVVVYEPTTFSYQYDYLFMWYANKKYGRLPIPNERRVKIAYYMIEPDHITGRREKWLKERDGEGKILWEKKYWGTDFTLQKRIRDDI